MSDWHYILPADCIYYGTIYGKETAGCRAALRMKHMGYSNAKEKSHQSHSFHISHTFYPLCHSDLLSGQRLSCPFFYGPSKRF